MGNKQSKDNNIHAGHRQRIKTKFIESGLSPFEDHQALELLLFYALPQKDTNELAHSLINEFGSLAGVFEASAEALQRVNGVGENTACLIKLIPEMYSRYLKSKAENAGVELKTAKEACDYFYSLLMNRQEEVLAAAFLDSRLCIKRTVIISEGGLTNTDVSLRKIVNKALDLKTPNIMLAHNHPSGVAAPSANDIEAVRVIAKTLRTLELHLCDSIIVAGENSFSMAGSKKLSYLFK